MPAQPSRLVRIERRLRALQQQIANVMIDRRLARLRLKTLALELRNLREIESSLRQVHAAEIAAEPPRLQQRSQDQQDRIDRILAGSAAPARRSPSVRRAHHR
jgi:ABC-type phosphate transport system auxiliary subunit